MTTVTRATEYVVSSSLFPEDDINSSIFEIRVAYRGRDLWAVTRHRQCLSRAGAWDYESVPSERTDEWLTEHRFPLDEALRLAEAEVPNLRVNGLTAAGLHDWAQRQRETQVTR